MGFVWAPAREGDVLVVFDGAPTPHVLRPAVGQEAQSHTLVGQAHVNGMMDGKVYTLGIQKQDITLV